MDIEIDKDRVITKFKRNGHFLTRHCLDMVVDHLRGVTNPGKRLDEIIKKINEMVIMNQETFNESTLKLTMELLSHRTETGRTFDSLDALMKHLRKWTTFYLNPYESQMQFFVDRPDPQLFKFVAQDFILMNSQRFKAIKAHNFSEIEKNDQNTFIGVLYESYSTRRMRIMLQNQVNEIELVLPSGFQTDCFLIPGCTYIAKGEFKNKELQLTVSEIALPEPLPSKKENLLSAKLKTVCDNLLLLKDHLNFSVQDFRSYEVIYNKNQNKQKRIIILGNFKINQLEINRLIKILKCFGQQIECVIIMMGEKDHEPVDLKTQIGSHIPIYIIPHLDSQGPRILPKIPVLRNDYNVKVTSNPARFSIQGKQCVFLNYPLVKNLYSRSLIAKEMQNVDSGQIARRVTRMLYSQNNVGICNKFYWRQSDYLGISRDCFLFVCDKACPQIEQQNFVSVGNFHRDGDFVCFAPNLGGKEIELCGQPE